MKKIFLSFALLLLLSLNSVAQGSDDGFRGFKWGTEISEIKKATPNVIERYAYHYIEDKAIKINNYVAHPFYFVLNDVMVCGGYIFDKGDNDAFDAIDEALEEKYGDTDTMDERFYRNGRDLLRNFEEQYYDGNLYYLSQWNLEKITIFHTQEYLNETDLQRVYYCSAEMAGREYEMIAASSLEESKDEL